MCVGSECFLLYVPTYLRTCGELWLAASLSVYTPVLSCVTVITNQRLILSVEHGLGLKSRQIGNLPMPFMANRTNFMPTKISPIQYGKDRTYCITSDEVFHLYSQIVRFMQYNSKKPVLSVHLFVTALCYPWWRVSRLWWSLQEHGGLGHQLLIG